MFSQTPGRIYVSGGIRIGGRDLCSSRLLVHTVVVVSSQSLSRQRHLHGSRRRCKIAPLRSLKPSFSPPNRALRFHMVRCRRHGTLLYVPLLNAYRALRWLSELKNAGSGSRDHELYRAGKSHEECIFAGLRCYWFMRGEVAIFTRHRWAPHQCEVTMMSECTRFLFIWALTQAVSHFVLLRLI